jgi:hypothetical protein
MRKIIAILVAMAMACVFTPMIGADGTETILVTLDPSASANITCNQSAWSPSCILAGTESTSVTWGKVENTGLVAVSVVVKATDSAAWTIVAAEAHNVFQLDITGGNAVALTTGDQSFDSNIAAAGQAGDETTFGLKVDMPTTSSTNTAQTSTITFTATVIS